MDVKIVVAVLDYFSNVTDNMDMTTLVSEVHIGEIIGLSLREGLTGLFNHSYSVNCTLVAAHCGVAPPPAHTSRRPTNIF
jgi:hypothetical protein